MVLPSERIVWLVFCLPPGCQYLHKDLCIHSHRRKDNTWNVHHSWSLFCMGLEPYFRIPTASWGTRPLSLQEKKTQVHILEHSGSFPPWQRWAAKISALCHLPRLAVLPLLVLRGHSFLSPPLVPSSETEPGVCAQVTEEKPSWSPRHVTRWRQSHLS